MLLQKKNTSFRIGLTIAVIMAALALIGYVWTPYDPVAIAGSQKFLPPSLHHLFGTDNFGRDIFSRVMAGMGTTFFISLCTVAIGGAVGTLVGAFTGYFGGVADEVLMRVNDALTAFPNILLALVFIAMLGFGKYNVILALGVAFSGAGGVCPPPLHELCQICPIDGSLPSADHLPAHSAQHMGRAAAGAGHRV